LLPFIIISSKSSSRSAIAPIIIIAIISSII
jgi:hypothetical protein